MVYTMVDLKGKNSRDFDAKKWGEKNKELAKKSSERWRKDNIEKGKAAETSPEDKDK